MELPDGRSVELLDGASAATLAAHIGPGLARAALGADVDGEVVDLGRPLPHGARVRLLTRSDPEALALLRHSAAHVLATAVRRIEPGAGIGFGPAIDDGFYYDFDVLAPFTPEQLEAIEREMAAVVAADYPFERRVVTRREARGLFADDPLKLERLEEFGDDDVITIYQDGPFVDLCRGPHIPSTGRLEHFKLLSSAGAYWRGDERRPMLQRIYGTAFFSGKELTAHLHRLEEARKRDHRMLGKNLDLFSIQEKVGAGFVLWHPNGGRIRLVIEDFLRQTLVSHGYEMVYTPHVAHEDLYRMSGHLDVFQDDMFPAMSEEGNEDRFRLKPMNCPHHFMIYRSSIRSYRDLPLRFAELGTCYRYERSGSLHGMMRSRAFTQDDAHIFIREDQIEEEYERLLALGHELLSVFGYTYRTALSTRPEKAIGDPAVYDRASERLGRVLERRGLEFELDRGGGAFYGPKVDILVTDALGREWQGGTFQLDFLMPERFDLEYVGADNKRHRPVVIHRTLLGSMERFVGGLIEHYAGAFPLWLAPEQVRVLPVSEAWAASSDELAGALRDAGLRACVDERETLGYRIRAAEKAKIPFMGIVGEREAKAGTVSVRRRGAKKKQVTMERGAFVEMLVRDVEARTPG